jgi:hypothetical protein
VSYKLQDADYLDLWKYFEDRADSVKEAMFNSVTWAVGFAAAVMSLAATTLIDFGGSALHLKHPILVLAAAIVGLILCAYALILISESAGHIRRNWARAQRCKDNVEGLNSLFEAQGPRTLQVWRQIVIVVGLFITGFTGIGVAAICSM